MIPAVRRAPMPQDGFTIIELMVAITIATMVILVAGRAFLFGNRQFLLDVHESKKLNRMILAKQTAEFLIRKEILDCKQGTMSVQLDSNRVEAGPLLRKKFPELGKVEFRCYVASSKPGEIADWKGDFQPQLVEYSSVPSREKQGFSIFGSILK